MPNAIDTVAAVLAYVSRVCGFDTIDAFPVGHVHARTRWNGAYFDIASDLKPEQIEQALCDAIANTPSVFAHISNPTVRMQRELLALISTRVRRSCGSPNELVAMLIGAYASAHTVEALPGLRAAIASSAGQAMADRVHALLAFLAQMPSAYDVIELR